MKDEVIDMPMRPKLPGCDPIKEIVSRYKLDGSLPSIPNSVRITYDPNREPGELPPEVESLLQRLGRLETDPEEPRGGDEQTSEV